MVGQKRGNPLEQLVEVKSASYWLNSARKEKNIKLRKIVD